MADTVIDEYVYKKTCMQEYCMQAKNNWLFVQVTAQQEAFYRDDCIQNCSVHR